MKNIKDFKWEPDFIRGIGVIPCPYHRYYFKKREMLESELKAYAENGTRAETVKKLEEELFELYKDETLDIKPPQLQERGGAYYSDAACRLINSIYNDTMDIQPVNTMNRGALADIAYDSAVEVSCVITKNGPVPLSMGHLPTAVRGLVQQIKAFEQTAADAAMTGDYNLALAAMTMNPLVQEDVDAKVLLDEMLEAHKDHLPQFFVK